MFGIARIAAAALLLAACGSAGDVRHARVSGAQVAYATFGTAGPVVVLESGLGEDMREWRAVAQALAPCARVVTYDRPGIGRSAPRPDAAALLAGPPLPPVPLVVLAATDHGDTPGREALWRDVQARTAALSPRGRFVVVEGSGHFVQTERPAAVVDAVLQAAREAGADAAGCAR